MLDIIEQSFFSAISVQIWLITINIMRTGQTFFMAIPGQTFIVLAFSTLRLFKEQIETL